MPHTLERPRARSDAVNRRDVDSGGLARALRRHLRGEVRFGAGDRALYASDASNYRQVPIGVVLPRDADDIVATVAIAREFHAPVLMRGGGTSLAGQTCNVAVVIDASKYYNRVLDLDLGTGTAMVEPGIVLDELRKQAGRHGLTYGPDPATHNRCTIGGMLGNNSCGVHSVMAEFYGPGPMTAHQVESLEVLTYDGARFTVGPVSDEEFDRVAARGGRQAEIYAGLRALRDHWADEIRQRFPRHLLRRASGFALDWLLPEHGFHVARSLVGTEGTCVSILSATVRLMPAMPHRALLVLGYDDVIAAARDVEWVRELRPVALEGLDDLLVEQMTETGIHPRDVRLLPEGRGWLMVEFGGADADEARARAESALEKVRARRNGPSWRMFENPDEEHKLWEVREAGLAATAFVPGEPDAWPGWEDSAVPVEHLADYLVDLRALMSRHGLRAACYGHFGHGLVHCRLPFDLVTEPGIVNFRLFMREASELVTQKYGGTLSGEHGDGQARGEFLPIMYGDALVGAFHEFHDLWDPDDGMNPDKSIGGYTCTENLRLGLDYAPPQPVTQLAYPADHGEFSRAVLRCVGVGLCRRHEHGTMCPSYMVTREEKHTTRGRARLLFEMMQGQELSSGWRSEEVKSSLDLCLACKGCKGDCPVNVDMAAYKAEFLSHYYERRLRPRSAYAFGRIDRWARLASRMPGVVNALTHAPGLATLAKKAVGIAAPRSIPRFAPRTFTDWFRSRQAKTPPVGTPRRMLLWPDTFNNHFYPGTLAAGLDLIESAGWSAAIPPEGLCCGRPLYDFGMLDQARRQLRDILGALRDEITAGTPVVGLEPSCVSVFRDELTAMLPGDEDARRLSRLVRTFDEFMQERTGDGWSPPSLPDRPTIVQCHCHHRAVMKLSAEQAMLGAMRLRFEVLDSGCCGMAGAFGFQARGYDVSIAAGERVLLPRVRAADDSTIVIADGFSCRQQIEQTTDRCAIHLAEAMQLALHAPDLRLDSARPEALIARLRPPPLRGSA